MRMKLCRRVTLGLSLLLVTGLFLILMAGPVLAAAPPNIANLTGTVTFTENGGAILLDDGDAAVSGSDGDYTGGNVTLVIANSTANDNFGVDGTNVKSGGDGVIVGGETITVGVTDIGIVATDPNDGQGGNDLVINLNAAATDGLLSTLLQNINFNNVSEDPDATARTVTVTANDGATTTDPAAVVTINITTVNDPPTLAATGLTPTFTEGGAAVDLFNAVTISTIEAGQNIAELRLTVTNVTDGASEIMSIDLSDVALTDGNVVTPTTTNGMTVNVAVAANTATVTITKGGGISTALMQTLVDGMTYRNESQNPTAGDRVVTLTYIKDTGGVADGGDDDTVLAVASTVTVTPVNDRPVVGNLGGDSVDVIAGGNAVAIDENNDATVTDVDSADFNGGYLSIAQGGGTANGNFGVDGTIVTSDGDATIAAGQTIAVGGTAIGTVDGALDGQGGHFLTITFNTADATPANVQTLVRNLTYGAPSGLGARNFELTIDDNDGDTHVSVAAAFTVTVVSVEMGLEGGGNPIADGGTHSFGYNVINTNTDITFTIQNTGDSNLTLTTPIAIAGADAGQFSIQLQPVSPVAAAGTTTFTVRFTPTTTGAKTATISIANNDSNENPYDLTITGFGYLTSGGTGSAVPSIATNIFGTPGSFLTDSQGTLLTTVTATSADGNTTISIPAGTQCLDEYGSPLTTITTVVVTPPAPPANANVIGLAYDFEPDGATFDPAFTITWSYDPDNLPEGVAAEDLVIAYYNEATGQWVELVCTVDTVNHTITAVIADFTTFAVLGSPQPAVFAVSGLNISPAESEPGEAVTVSVAVANTGGTAGDYAVTLKVNGVAMDATTVTLDAGGTGTVTFTLSGQPEGSYAVDVNGLAGSYTVAAPPAEPEPTTPAPTEEPTTAPTTEPTTTPTTTPTDTPATTPTATTPPEDEAEPFNSWWIIILVGGAIIIGILIWILTRSRR